MLFDMILGRLVAVADGLLRVAVRDERLMRGTGVVLFRVISRGFAMMPRCLLVMARRSLVVLGSAENLAHEVLQFGRFLMRAGGAHRATRPFPQVPRARSEKKDRVRAGSATTRMTGRVVCA
jgi:hypothetical protein